MINNQSKIDQLISELCPNGVEFKELSELGNLYGGLTGKSKNDFTDGNAKFITYMNIFSNISVDTDVDIFVKIKSNEKQNEIQYGDVLFTGSSENANECGMSSVLTKKIDEPLYLNSFCFGFRLYDKSLFLPDFLKYLFRDEEQRKQIAKTASGVTRFNVSKKRFAKLKIPIPPLKIQEEIVDILDKFTQLEAELEAELEARKKQYEYYRDELLENNDANIIALEDIAEYSKNRISAENLDNKSYIGVDSLLQDKKGRKDSNHVPTVGNSTQYKKEDILIGNIRPYLKKIWFSDRLGGTNGDVLVISLKESKKGNIIPRFLYYILSSDKFFEYNMQNAKGAKMPRGNKEAIMKYTFTIPSFEEQNRIVFTLDKFDALVNDISIGLPAELKARKQQYEYYRNKLLTFKEYER